MTIFFFSFSCLYFKKKIINISNYSAKFCFKTLFFGEGYWNLTKVIKMRVTIVFINNIYNILKKVRMSNTRIYDTNPFFS